MIREFLVLDALVQGVPEALETICEWVTRIDPESAAEFQDLQRQVMVSPLTDMDIADTVLTACHAGMVRALRTDEDGAITSVVENDPVLEEMHTFFFEISHLGKMRWKELESAVLPAGDQSGLDE